MFNFYIIKLTLKLFLYQNMYPTFITFSPEFYWEEIFHSVDFSCITKTYSKYYQTSKMDRFAKIVNGF